jgi:glycosyltransferase involved in cell wall biosynthesis
MVRMLANSNPLAAARPTLLVFADDWGRHPSSCQHLVRSMANDFAVLWVNTIGTRQPKFDLATVARGWEKLRHWSRRPANAAKHSEEIGVLNPLMWPSFRSRCSRWLNRNLLRHQLTSTLASAARPVIAVTTLPIVADLVGRLQVDRWIYYCVDDFSVWPGLDHGPLRLMERQLISQMDDIIVVSEPLKQRIEGMGRSCALLTHGVELTHWSGRAEPAVEPLARLLNELEKPWFVFWGVVDRRLNTEFIVRLSNEMDHGTILLAGPEQNPDPALLELPRVARLGSLPYEVLPQLAAEAAVLVMPYADLEVTRAMQPLKMKEYLATGKPVVVSDLPACSDWSDCLDVVRTSGEFSATVRRRASAPLTPEQQTARMRLCQETWDSKAEEFGKILLGDAFSECGPQTATAIR